MRDLPIERTQHRITRTYRVAQNTVNIKYSLLLREMLRIKPVNQFVGSCHSIVYIEHGKPHLEKLYVNLLINKEYSNMLCFILTNS